MMNEQYTNLITPFGLLIFAVIIVAIILIVFDFNYLDLAGIDHGNKHITFYVLFEFNVRSVYNGQTNETMNILLNGIQTIMGSHVERPAVLMFLAPTEAYFTALTLAKTLVKTALVSFGRQWTLNDLDRIFLKGSKFSAVEDYWKFHKKILKRINNFNAVVIERFQQIHPQVSTVLCNIADDTFSPFPRCIIILIMDVNNYFSEKALNTMPAITLAESYLQISFGPFLDELALNDLMRVITGRTVIIKREKQLEELL